MHKLTDSSVGTRRFLFFELTAPPLDSHDDEGVECGVEQEGWELSFAVFTATPSSNFIKQSVIVDSVPFNFIAQMKLRIAFQRVMYGNQPLGLEVIEKGYIHLVANTDQGI